MTETNLSTLEEAYNCSDPIVITDLQHPFQIIFANKVRTEHTNRVCDLDAKDTNIIL